ncbi:MAG: pantoate--beta-alanine ligase [Bryobacteraceae bacterium]
MLVFESIGALRQFLRSAPRPVGLVPTMGGLHAGHGRLIEEARRASATVVVSIFVNPTQFNRSDDFAGYPRDLPADLAFCEARGVDAVFAPSVAEMYPRPLATFVEPGRVAEHMEGRFRPGHFRGVATVVLQLFQIVQPERAWFGEKDAQQLAVIRRMVADLDIPLEVVGVPTVREPDGLALSTRNRRLSAEERSLAPRIYRALRAGVECIAAGETDAAVVKRAALAVLGDHARLRIEYLEIADEAEMQPTSRISGPVRIAAAVWVGGTRLIDNLRWEVIR